MKTLPLIHRRSSQILRPSQNSTFTADFPPHTSRIVRLPRISPEKIKKICSREIRTRRKKQTKKSKAEIFSENPSSNLLIHKKRI